jgi:hypothetical protein
MIMHTKGSEGVVFPDFHAHTSQEMHSYCIIGYPINFSNVFARNQLLEIQYSSLRTFSSNIHILVS